MDVRPVRVGLIGCGTISGEYFAACRRYDVLSLVACADLDQSRSAARAAEHGVRAVAVDELLADPEIELVLDLTPPAAHAEIGMAALAAGKHVYHEKPLAIRLDDGRRMLEYAERRGLCVGCAPDTFLGAGLQTCRRRIDEGLIGEPVSVTAAMMGGGHETWHPDPDFFYRPGGGPMFDMGVYALAAMVQLLGPMRRVTGVAGGPAERTVLEGPRAGRKIRVEVPTYVSGAVDFDCGAIATIVATFDARAGSMLPRFEVYGTEGTLSLGDPNAYGGPVRYCPAYPREWVELPLVDAGDARGIGLADMALALRRDRPHRAGAEMALHVLEAMEALERSAATGRHVELVTTCGRPDPWQRKELAGWQPASPEGNSR